MLIDTHCHLNFKTFKDKIDKVVNQAKKTGVTKIIVPGANLDSSKKAVELAEKYDGVYAAVGIHPVHAEKELSNFQIVKLSKRLEELARSKKVVAIGECGLDYFKMQNDKFPTSLKLRGASKIIESQKQIFEMQIKLANELSLPLIVHNRQASEDILKIISNQQLIINHLRGVFHCFQGNLSLLSWALKNNFYIGITGIVTYDKQMRQVVKETPLENLLVETDSPFLTPELLRSQKVFPNTPANVKIVTERVAKIKNISYEEVVKKTKENAEKLFFTKN